MAHYPALDYNTKLDYDDGLMEFVEFDAYDWIVFSIHPLSLVDAIKTFSPFLIPSLQSSNTFRGEN